MKLIIGILVILAPLMSHAVECPDLSGKYKSENSLGVTVMLMVTQEGCERLTMDFDYGHRMMVTRTLIFDGVQRLVFSSSESRTYETDLITSEGIIYESLDEYTRSKAVYFSRGTIVLDDNKNLNESVDVYNDKNQLLKTNNTTFSRQ